MNQLIRCIDCDDCFMKTPFDQWPECDDDRAHLSGPVRSVVRDDHQEFLVNHRGHRLEYLDIIEDSFVSEEVYFEPVKISYFRATNKKKEKFVIKQFREEIGEPLKYQLIHGDYFLECLGLEVQSEEITKQLKAEFKKHSLSHTQISTFLKLCRHIIHSVDIKSLERVSQESSHPLEGYYKMDDVSLFYLLRNCRHIFGGKEYADIEDFIYRHKDDGVLLLKARYKIQIAEKAKPKQEAAPALIPQKVKKAKEEE